MNDAKFTQEIIIAVTNYGGSLLDINLKDGTFRASCPKKNSLKCAEVLEEIMDRYYPEEGNIIE